VTTETVAVISSSSVAALAIVANLFQYRGRVKHERELHDLDNVRNVLDDAAELLHRIAYVLDNVQLGLTQYGAGFFKDEKRVATYDKLEQVGREADGLRARLAVRLRVDHEVVKAFTEANEAVLAIYRALGMIRFESDPPPDPTAEKQVREIIDAERDKITAGRKSFDKRRDDFMNAASRTAGARLPSARRRWWKRGFLRTSRST
jgi:hypothetical protein